MDIKAQPQEEYEKLLFPLFLNASNKLTAAMCLHQKRIFYDSAFALAVIAEEELAKLILVPIGIATGTLPELFSERDGAFFHHKKKQRLSSMLCLFEKDSSEIEKRKQDALYISNDGSGMQGMNISEDECFNEIAHSTWVFLDQFNYLNKESQRTDGAEISEKLTGAVLTLCHVIGGCIDENLPKLKTEAQKRIAELEKETAIPVIAEKNLEKFVLKSPYERIRLFKTLFPSNYKTKLEETIMMTCGELHKYLIKETDWNQFEGCFKDGKFI